MGEEEMDILESICGLHRHPNAAQTIRSKRYSCCMDEQSPAVETTQSPVETSVNTKNIAARLSAFSSKAKDELECWLIHQTTSLTGKN
jgi:hypothetical protein